MTKTMVKNESIEFKNFLKKYSIFIGISFLIIACTYWPKIIYKNYSIDTEEFMLLGKKSGFTQWLAIGRYGLFLMKKFITGYDINIRFINIMTYLFLFLTIILLGYIVSKILINITNLQLLTIPMLFATSPIMLEQLNFILQSLEVSLSYLFVCFAIYLCYLASKSKNKLLYTLSILFTIASFSIYPSNYLSFIVLAIAIIMLIITTSDKQLTIKSFFYTVLPYGTVFIISFIADKLLYNLVLKIYHVSKDTYVNDSALWGKASTEDIFNRIMTDLQGMYTHPIGLYFNYSMLLGIILLFITITIQKNNKGWLYLCGISILIASNPYIFILGYGGPIRSMAPFFPMFVMFCFLYSVYFLKNKYFKILICLTILYFGCLQIKRTCQFGIQEEQKFQEEVAYVHNIVTDLDAQGLKDYSNYSVAVLGTKHFPVDKFHFKGDVLGESFFEWDQNSPVGSSKRVSNFFNTLGYPVKTITQSEYIEAIQYAESHPMAKDSVSIYKDIIILKVY